MPDAGWCGRSESNRHSLSPEPDFESGASTNSTTPAMGDLMPCVVRAVQQEPRARVREITCDNHSAKLVESGRSLARERRRGNGQCQASAARAREGTESAVDIVGIEGTEGVHTIDMWFSSPAAMLDRREARTRRVGDRPLLRCAGRGRRGRLPPRMAEDARRDPPRRPRRPGRGRGRGATARPRRLTYSYVRMRVDSGGRVSTTDWVSPCTPISSLWTPPMLPRLLPP